MTDNVPVDISESRVIEDRLNPEHSFLGHGLKELPYDLPADIHITRHLREKDGVKGLVGWTMEVRVACRGNVKIKIAREGGMEVWVDDERVAKEPFKPYER